MGGKVATNCKLRRTQALSERVDRKPEGLTLCTGCDLASWSQKRTPFLLETNLPGISCAGDANGVGDRSIAIAFVHQYLVLQQHGSGTVA